MSPFTLTFWLAPFLIHLFQATLFGTGIAILIAAVPFLTARFRHLLGWIGLAKFVLPLALVGIVLPAGAPPALSGAWLTPFLVAGRTSPGSAVSSWGTLGLKLAVMIWLIGVALWLGLMIVRSFRFSRQLHAGSVPFAPELQHQLATLAGTVGVSPARVSGWISPAQMSPGVAGLFRSRIHVPRELLHTLNRDEIEAVLLHELVHVARRDNLWRLIQALIAGIFWFHPLVWWLHGRLIRESEQACDERVVSLTRDRETYAQGMVKAASHALGLNVPGFSGMARSGLNVRLKAVLNPKTKKDHIMLRTALIIISLTGFVFTAGATVPVKQSNTLTLPTDFAPRPVEQTRPVYPKELRDAKIEGSAKITIIVDADGVVRYPEVAYATRPEFGQAALTAVSQWKFMPGIKGGRKVNTRLTVPIVFSLAAK